MIIWHLKDKNIHMLCFPTDAIFGQNTKHIPYNKDAIEVSFFYFPYS